MCIHTIRYDSVYLTCSKKLTGSQLSLTNPISFAGRQTVCIVNNQWSILLTKDVESLILIYISLSLESFFDSIRRPRPIRPVSFTFTSFRTCLFIVFIINIIIIHHSFTVHIFHIPTYRLNPPFHQTLPTMHLGCWYPSYCLHGLSDPFCGCYMLIFLKLLGQPRPTTTCEVRFHSHVLKCLFVDNITEKRFVKMFVCWQHYGKSS